MMVSENKEGDGQETAKTDCQPANVILRFFDSSHLTSDLQTVAIHCEQLAFHMEALLPNSAEKSAGLRKLLEAKDCFVRAMLPPTPASASGMSSAS